MDELRAHWRRQERQQRFSLFVIHHLTAITSDRRCDPEVQPTRPCFVIRLSHGIERRLRLWRLGSSARRQHLRSRPRLPLSLTFGWHFGSNIQDVHGRSRQPAQFLGMQSKKLLMSAKVAELAISSLRFEDVTDRETFVALEPDEPE